LPKDVIFALQQAVERKESEGRKGSSQAYFANHIGRRKGVDGLLSGHGRGGG